MNLGPAGNDGTLAGQEQPAVGSLEHVVLLIRPHFDSEYYSACYRDLAGDAETLLHQFCLTGWKEGRNPNAAFDTVSYLDAYPDVAASGLNPFYHYLLAGYQENRLAVPAFAPREIALRVMGHDPGDWVELVRSTFDTGFYTAQLTPPYDGSFDPAAHFCYRGWLAGLSPSRAFDMPQALHDQPELLHQRLNPLVYRLGARPAPAAPTPVAGSASETDDGLQFTRFPRAALTGIDGRLAALRDQFRAAAPQAAASTVTHADDVERLIAQSLDTAYYLQSNPDVRAAGIDPVFHYCNTGWTERRNPAPDFDTAYYLAANADIAALGINPYWHYLVAGRAEGRPGRQPGGPRRAIIDAAVDPDVITNTYCIAEPEHVITRSRLDKLLRATSGSSNGLVLSIGHDCYIRAVGGIQLFIANEQARFAARGVAYLNLSPYRPLLRLADPNADGLLVNMVLNGEMVGVANTRDLAATLRKITRRDGELRVLLVHCLLGHQVPELINLHAALACTSSVFWVHDYSSICSGFTLLRNDAAYCHAPPPDSMACRLCVYGDRRADHLRQIRALFDAVPFHVVAPSQAALDVWQEHAHLPYVTAQAHEHCDIAPLPHPAVRRPADRPVRLAYVGYPRPHKGWLIWRELVTRTSHTGAYEFLHIGSEGTDTSAPGIQHHLAATSADQPDGIIQTLAALEVDLVLALSTWPETFSYVAHEALAAGADLVCLSDSGNVAAAALRRRRGVVARDEESLYAFFESLRAVEYVRLCREQPAPLGELVHDGTSATLNWLV